MLRIVHALLLTGSFIQLVTPDTVPVFLWSSDGSLKLPDTYSGHAMSEGAFREDYLASVMMSGGGAGGIESGEVDEQRNIVVFLQDELSLDSLTRSADIFNSYSDGADLKHLKVAMTSHDSVFLPTVTSAAEAVESLLSDADSLHLTNHMVVSELEKPYLIDSAPESESAPRLFIVRVPQSASLKEIDNIIGVVTKQLEHSGRPFSAVYTASHSSVEPLDDSDQLAFSAESGTNQKRGGRRLLQDDSQYVAPAVPLYYTFVNFTNCVYLYTQNITLTVAGYDPWTLPLNPTIDESSFCINYTAELSLTYTDVDEILKEVNLLFVFDVSAGLDSGYWFVSNFTLSYTITNGTTTNETLEMNPFFVSETPYGLSYSCFEMPPILPIALEGQPQLANITFIGLQAFNITDDAFGYYNDCRGFFSIQTWACVITLFILAAILFFAACMFLGLSTPDRFDDPRGKTITVNEM